MVHAKTANLGMYVCVCACVLAVYVCIHDSGMST